MLGLLRYRALWRIDRVYVITCWWKKKKKHTYIYISIYEYIYIYIYTHMWFHVCAKNSFVCHLFWTPKLKSKHKNNKRSCWNWDAARRTRLFFLVRANEPSISSKEPCISAKERLFVSANCPVFPQKSPLSYSFTIAVSVFSCPLFPMLFASFFSAKGICLQTHSWMCIYIHACTYTHDYIHVYIYIDVCIDIYADTHIYRHIYTHHHIYICTRIDT